MSAAQSPVQPFRGDTGRRESIVASIRERRVRLSTALLELERDVDALVAAAGVIVDALRRGNKVLVAGNGGSAAEAQHFAAELVGRFKLDRSPFAAIAMTTNSSILTAVANDYGFADVFGRQVLALGRPGDVLLAYSTSGESENLIRAALAARETQMTIVAVIADRDCRLQQLADISIRIPSSETATTQELHMMVTHMLCEIVEAELACSGTAR